MFSAESWNAVRLKRAIAVHLKFTFEVIQSYQYYCGSKLYGFTVYTVKNITDLLLAVSK